MTGRTSIPLFAAGALFLLALAAARPAVADDAESRKLEEVLEGLIPLSPR
jgi:hypothetical protein